MKKMASLAERSVSSPSLLRLPQQKLHNGLAALPVYSSPAVRRSLREKERFLLPRVFRVALRRDAMMLLMFVVSLVLLCSLFALIKDDETLAASEIHMNYSYRARGMVIPRRTTPVNARVPLRPADQQSVVSDDQIRFSAPIIPPGDILQHHPCENFTFTPPAVHKKRTGPRPCPVCYVTIDQAAAFMPPLPSSSPVLKNLTYVAEDSFISTGSSGGSIFGGHPSLQQRSESFDIRESMAVHCGFANGKKPGQGTGFDIDTADRLEMEKCKGVVVASAIFGNYDEIQQPKNISEYSKMAACFYMFVDEETEAYLRNSSSVDNTNKVGLWRLVLVRNLPYVDPRRNGKIPKLLLHRLLPNARFSVWIDAKLELVVDPYLLLERFLWRKNVTFAISRHYKRFDVFEEAEANKAGGKYANASIDYQIEFYKNEGLTHYSLDKLPITSDVPEGCVIIREHIPISNLFTCLWFNEVDRFTSRDQISFSTVRDHIRSKVNWWPEMFMDCERRNFVVQAYHKDMLEKMLAVANQPPPSIIARQLPRKLKLGIDSNENARTRPKKPLARHHKDKKAGSRQRHTRSSIGKVKSAR